MRDYTALKIDLELLDNTDVMIKDKIRQISSKKNPPTTIEGLADSISQQFELEEKTMEKIGLSLTPIHLEEHKKLLEEIMALEFSWQAQKISNEVYIKSINYKLEFHHHYFDKTQRLLLLAQDQTT